MSGTEIKWHVGFIFETIVCVSDTRLCVVQNLAELMGAPESAGGKKKKTIQMIFAKKNLYFCKETRTEMSEEHLRTLETVRPAPSCQSVLQHATGGRWEEPSAEQPNLWAPLGSTSPATQWC